jgi:transcriptional antiterminator NusG
MKAAENRRMTDLIKEVKIPMETVTEFTDGGEKTVERKVFPVYVLLKMILTDDSWHLVHNVRGATGFVGADGKAIPLTEQEIYDLGVEHKEIHVGYAVGDSVRVADGPLTGFIGKVEEIVDDDTGEVLDSEMTKVGTVVVTEVKEKIAYTTPLEGAEKGMGVHPAK